MERISTSKASLGAAAGAEAALPFRLDDHAGLTYRGKPIYDLDQVVGQLDSGFALGGGRTFTYGFLDTPVTVGVYNNPNYAAFFPEPGGYTPFDEAQRDAVRLAMRLWDDLIPQSIVEKQGVGADILYANTSTGPAQAWAYYPGVGYKFQSDVWTATPSENWTNAWLGYNGYGLTTIVHEAGHALGLSHPGDYNFGDDNDGDGQPDPITYLGDAFYAQDSLQFTIMSYFSQRETGAYSINLEVGLLGYPQTPLLHDIVAIQAKYGADPTTRTGDTVYGFNSNAGLEVYDFSVNRSPYLSIYDAGGEDTLDLSGAGAGVFLDLRPGSFSSAATRPTLAQANAATEAFNAVTDEAQGDFALWTAKQYGDFLTLIAGRVEGFIAAATGVGGVYALSHANISIAYNTVIENAVGGAHRDYLVGNHVGNKLYGNGGDDVLNGLGGDDTLWGGAGADEFRFTELGGTDFIADYERKDFLNLSEIDANVHVAGDQAFKMVSAFTGKAGQAVLSYDAAANLTRLQLDVDGDGVSDLDILINGQVQNTAGWIL